MSQGPQGKSGTAPGPFGACAAFAVSAGVRGTPGIGEDDMPEVERKLLLQVAEQLKEFVHDTVELKEVGGAVLARVEFCAVPKNAIKFKGGAK